MAHRPIRAWGGNPVGMDGYVVLEASYRTLLDVVTTLDYEAGRSATSFTIC